MAEIVALLPVDPDSYMFHWPNAELVGIFAEAVGLPLRQVRCATDPEREVEILKQALAEADAEGVVSGAVASRYQKSRIDSVCRELGLESIAPLWGRQPEEVLKAEVDSGFEILITGVAAHGLDERWLGRTFDAPAVEEFLRICHRYQINPVGEGGEYETFVVDGPIFKKKIRILEAEKQWMGTRGYYLIKRAELEEKK